MSRPPPSASTAMLPGCGSAGHRRQQDGQAHWRSSSGWCGSMTAHRVAARPANAVRAITHAAEAPPSWRRCAPAHRSSLHTCVKKAVVEQLLQVRLHRPLGQQLPVHPHAVQLRHCRQGGGRGRPAWVCVCVVVVGGVGWGGGGGGGGGGWGLGLERGCKAAELHTNRLNSRRGRQLGPSTEEACTQRSWLVNPGGRGRQLRRQLRRRGAGRRSAGHPSGHMAVQQRSKRAKVTAAYITSSSSRYCSPRLILTPGVYSMVSTWADDRFHSTCGTLTHSVPLKFSLRGGGVWGCGGGGGGGGGCGGGCVRASASATHCASRVVGEALAAPFLSPCRRQQPGLRAPAQCTRGMPKLGPWSAPQ